MASKSTTFVFSALEFCCENALYKFSFDIGIDTDIVVVTLVGMMTAWNVFVHCYRHAAVLEVRGRAIIVGNGNVVDDANLAELYDADTLQWLRYRFLKQESCAIANMTAR